jgi:hypothetical protein
MAEQTFTPPAEWARRESVRRCNANWHFLGSRDVWDGPANLFTQLALSIERESKYPPELVERMVALVGQMATGEMGRIVAFAEAEAIHAALNPPKVEPEDELLAALVGMVQIQDRIEDLGAADASFVEPRLAAARKAIAKAKGGAA